MEREMRIAKAKQELIPRQHCIRQATFLVISLRQRLISLSSDLSRKIAESCNGDQRVIADLIDADVRDALSEIAQMPLRVTDEDWMQKLDEHEQPAKRPRRTAK